MTACIDARRGRFGVEPIWGAPRFAPSTYLSAKRRPASARSVRDEQLKVEITRVHAESFGVCGAPEVGAQLNRESRRVARCTMERLMRDLGISGVVMGKPRRPTVAGTAAERPRGPRAAPILGARPGPAVGWLMWLTYGLGRGSSMRPSSLADAYSRRIVGWQASGPLRGDLAINALEQAVWERDRAGAGLDGLVHHSDRRGRCLTTRHTERLLPNDIVASVGSKGDSYDCGENGWVIGLGLTLATTGR